MASQDFESDSVRRAFPWPLRLTLLATLLGVICAGTWGYVYHKNLVRLRALENLESQAFIRGQTLKKWYLERAAEVQKAWELPALSTLADEATSAGKAFAGRREAARAELAQYAVQRRFVAWEVLPGAEAPLFWGAIGLVGQPPTPPYLDRWPQGEPAVRSFFWRSADDRPMLTLYGPPGKSSRTVGVGDEVRPPPYWVTLTLDARAFLMPVLLAPPEAFPSQRSVLVQRGEDGYTFVNAVRSGPGEAPVVASERPPEEGPSARAATGDVFQGEFVDHRGIPAFFATTYVPFADWGLVIQVDRAEVYASLKTVAWLTWSLALLVVLLGGSVVWNWWEQQRRRIHEALATATLKYKTVVFP